MSISLVLSCSLVGDEAELESTGRDVVFPCGCPPGRPDGRRIGVTLKVLLNVCHFDSLGERFRLTVDLRAANYPRLFGAGAACQCRIKAAGRRGARRRPVSLPGDDNVLSPRQRPK